MNQQPQFEQSNSQTKAAYIRHLLKDVRALESMLEKGMLESEPLRIGAEQEFCIVTENWRPSKRSEEVLAALEDAHYTTELARYNIEFNADPLVLGGRCFSQLENELKHALNRADLAASRYGDKVVLTGILPTISKAELEMDYMTPSSRYVALNEMMKAARGGDFELNIRGVDELSARHQSVLFEACNTSFQMHLQITPDDFIASYNWAQAISGPLLAIATNSPLLLGRELWSETRIALFQQSIDTRASSFAIKDQMARVNFGSHWEQGNVTNIFKEAIAKFKVLLSRKVEHDSLEQLAKGEVPKLAALNLHNGTVYRWNRPCYGRTEGKPHIRIENRYIPAGPTIEDQVANFAFWVGLMKGRPAAFDHMADVMDFRDAKRNFFKAAQHGKESIMYWQGKPISVADLIINVLVPIARRGLEACKVDPTEIDRYLSVIERRTMGNTGSQWMVANYRNLRRSLKKDDALLALTKAIHANQRSGHPVAMWHDIDPSIDAHEAAELVSHVMSTALFTVNDHDSAELAVNVMEWNNIHHLPVENDRGELVGILTSTHIERFIHAGGEVDGSEVGDVMSRSVLTIPYNASISEAIQTMKKFEIGSLPVLHDHQLVGIVTIEDVKQFDKGEEAHGAPHHRTRVPS